MSNDESNSLTKALKILGEVPVGSFKPVPDSLWVAFRQREVPVRQEQLGPHWHVVSFEEFTRGRLNGRLFNVAVGENSRGLYEDRGPGRFNQSMAELRFYLRNVPYDNLILA